MRFFSFSDPQWKPVEDTASLFSMIDLATEFIDLGDHVAVSRRSLPMYEAVSLLCLTSEKWKDLRVCFLQSGANIYRLDGTSSPIHEINAKDGISLTEENIWVYLSFFCFFVRGEEGPFYVLHDLDDELLPNGLPEVKSSDVPKSKTLRELFRRPRFFGRDDRGLWRMSAMVYYSNAVFLSDFLIHPTGMVEMQNDEPLLVNLPFKIHVPLVLAATKAESRINS